LIFYNYKQLSNKTLYTSYPAVYTWLCNFYCNTQKTDAVILL